MAAATSWLKAPTAVLLLLLLQHDTCGTHSCYAAATMPRLLLLLELCVITHTTLLTFARTWISWCCVQLRLYERQIEITLRRRWRLRIRIGAQPHPRIQQDGRPIRIYGCTSAEAAICI
jgi:hypothetical protein